MAGTGAKRLFAAVCGLLLVLTPFTVGHAQDIIPPKVMTLTPGGINISDGSWVYSHVDLSMGPLTLERYVRGGARQPNEAMFGYNFSSNFDIYIARTSGTNASNIVHIGNSASGSYGTTANGSGVYSGLDLDAGKGRLTTSGGKYVYTDGSGTIYTFSATVTAAGTPFLAESRRVERIDFPDGRRQTFTYTAQGFPRLVEDSSGYAILFDYVGTDVSAACIFKRADTYVDGTAGYTCASATLKATYTYTLNGTKNQLTNYTDATGKVTSYYPCLKPPGYASCTMTLGGTGPLAPGEFSFYVTQTLVDQGTWTIAGQLEQNGDGGVLCVNGNMSAGALSPDNKGNFGGTFTNSSPYTLSQHPDANHTTEFIFEGGVPTFPPIGSCNPSSYGSMLREAKYPEGDKYQAVYAGHFNALTIERHVPKGGGAPHEKLYQYVASCTALPGTYQNCAKPIAIRDPAGNWANYTYWPHGGVWTEMAPAPAAGAARPLKVTTWVQGYPWTRNSSNQLVQNLTLPVWLKSTETQCQTTPTANPSPTCDSGAPQTVTTYEYGTNGQSLLVRGVVVTAAGVSLRTCYGYDQFDRKIYETQPNGTTAASSCL